MKTAAFFSLLLWLITTSGFASNLAPWQDSTRVEPRWFIEAPFVLVPLGFAGVQFPDQALTPNLDPMFAFGGSYAFYPSLESNLAFEARLTGTTFNRNTWDLDYRPEIAQNEETTLELRSELTIFSLGLKYVPRHWKSSVRPFATAHFGRAFMHNTMWVEERCPDGVEHLPGMRDRFLRHTGYVYSFELGLEYQWESMVFFASINHTASWEEFNYYDFDALNDFRAQPVIPDAKTFVSEDEIRSGLVDFHKTAPRYRGRLSMFGFQVGIFWRLPL